VNVVIRLIARIYALLVRLYPRSFRAEFEEEMRTVFGDAATEAASRGRTSLLGLCLRELCDWPKALLSEHWHHVKTRYRGATTRQASKGDRPTNHTVEGRTVMPETREYANWSIASRRQALVAALPPLLYGLGIAMKEPVTGGAWYAVPPWRLAAGVAMVLIPAAVIAIGGLFALVRRLPDWGYTWVGAALMGLALLVKTLAEERADQGQFLISPVGDAAVGVVVLLAGLAVLIVAALRGWQQAGMVSIGLSATLGLSLCATVAVPPFHRHDLALLAGPLGLLVAVLTYAYARGPGSARGLGLTRIVILASVELVNVGLTWMADQAWQAWLLARGRPSPLWPLLVLLTGSLAAGPFLGLLGRPLRRALGRA
jgi:hypothetical protein